MKRIVYIIAILLIAQLPAAAQEVDSIGLNSTAPIEASPSAIWDSANTAYADGQYLEAIELYDTIAQQGLSSHKLFFNLGNAYYKSGDIARAILNYERALLIAPSDEDIRYNLSVAQSQTKDQIEAIPEFFLRSWNRSISQAFGCSGWTILSLVALAITLASIIIFLLGEAISIRKIGFGVGVLAAIIFVVTTAYALGERREILDHNRAVVMSQSISIKSSPNTSSTDLFMLHNGTTVKILRQIGDWCEVSIADGKTGWIEARRIEVI